ncbi:CDP-glycerol glycerophosphotransferase family protein [Enterococcus viikkiensis]|uniref:CDP-glycerol glycerophosphotransferase family protein n=1 Tax=Enterococcus viikkiensis TaxID=930854 RepID=UPI0010F5F066|nr:CDP-glycerol glycerophosphotransferase family protein [Enterococcus viikkiensis]
MKLKIGSKLKKNIFIYRIYFAFGNFFLFIMKIFYKNKKDIILFNSFGGKKIDDSPFELYQEIKKRDIFKNCKLIWAVEDIDQVTPPVENIISINSIKFFKMAIQSKVWITNSSMQRGLILKNSDTIYLNTWHGTPMKNMGIDIVKKEQSFQIREDKKDVDLFLVQSSYEKEIFENAFSMSEKQFLNVGYPRNDRLLNFDCTEVSDIKKRLNINNNKKVILYAPTFRPEVTDSEGRIVMDLKFDIHKMVETLGEDFIILLRAHYETYVPNFSDAYEDKFLNVTDYTNLNDLLIITDLLISDYSSIFFDYSLLSKPMIAYVYDFDEYRLKRGLYFDIREFLPSAKNMKELIDLIINYQEDSSSYIEKTKIFQKQFVEWYGNATVKTVDFLQNFIYGKGSG